MSHLPLSGTFRLVELGLSGLLPPEALAPFAAEIQQRTKRRTQRAAAERRALAREAAAARASSAAQQGPSEAELRAMPALDGSISGSAGPDLALMAPGMSEEELAESLALQVRQAAECAISSVPALLWLASVCTP